MKFPIKFGRVAVVLVIGLLSGVGYFIIHLSHAASADINGDGKVDVLDLSILASNYGKCGMSFSQGDLNTDGCVNVLDLSILAGAWGQTNVGTAPLGQTGTWKLSFDDEFNGSGLDLTKWIMCNPSFQSSCVPYNNEQELFNTILPSNPNVFVGGGNLNLVTTKQSGQIYSGMVSTGPNVFNANQPGYTGFQYTYGYYEARVKLPKGNGFWPSMWMLPDQRIQGPWPGSGEYDMFEVAGNDPTVIHMTEHDGTNGGAGDSATKTVADTSADYHVFGFDWEPDHLAWYFDGQRSRTMICTDAYAAANPGVCDSYRNAAAIKNYPFYIIANFSVGGSWPPLNGAPDASTPFPATMSIDWIRVWQH